MKPGNTPVGLTKDAGYQMGLRKTFSLPPAAAWDYLFSEAGLPLWLGRLHGDQGAYTNILGVEGRIRVFTPYSHIRMSWKKPGWSQESTLQMRVLNNNGRAVVAFHQEKLSDGQQREEMLAFWGAVMKEIEKGLLTCEG